MRVSVEAEASVCGDAAFELITGQDLPGGLASTQVAGHDLEDMCSVHKHFTAPC